MNLSRSKLSICLVAVLFGALSAFGQGWPMPAKTPNTDVACNGNACLGKEGKKVAGYPDIFKTFTGRFLDSVATRDYQFTFRTARARMLRIAPERNRIYMILGSAVVAYDMNTFFSRLEADETPYPSTAVPVAPSNTRAGSPEVFLMWDRFFYAESGGGWLTQGGDGQERLFGFDWDDRGNVYLAYGAYSWGIVKDPGDSGGGRMDSLYQHTNATSTDETDVSRIFTLKSGSSYYAVICGKYDRLNIFDVTNPSSPTKVRNMSGGPIVDFAKSADGRRVAVVKGDGSFAIYATDSFIAGAAPMLTRDQWSGSYGSVTTDGNEFFAGVRTVDGKMAISNFKESGGAFTETLHAMNIPILAGVQVRYGAGYISAASAESTYSAFNLRLFKLVNQVPTEVPLDGFYAKHYTGYSTKIGADYTYPAYSVLLDTMVHKKGSKTYLIVSNFGLGDVYELKSGDGMTPSIKKTFKTSNPNSAAAPGSGPHYGDEITFTSTPSGTAIPVTWEWGDGSTSETTPASNPDITHQFHGLSVNQLPATRTVTAINANDTAVRETLNVTLKAPTVRVGIRNTSLLFLQPNASAPASIVSGDEWIDASDGSDEGHFAEWSLDGTIRKQSPSQTLSVGDCGAHTLIYTGHYGRRDSSFNTVGGDAAISLNSIAYAVSPFVASVAAPLSSGGNVVFKSAARASSLAADMPTGAATAVTYTWELIDASGSVVASDKRLTGLATLASIPDFVVPRTTFQGATNWRARLKLGVDPTLITGAACKAFASAQAVTALLSGPDPGAIARTGCENAGGPCSLTVPSLSGGDQSSWSYQWSVSGPTTVFGGSLPTYTPSFSAPGSYTVTVNISNALGDAQKSLVINVAASACGSNPTDSNTSINFVGGGPSNCNGNGSTCSVGETVTFSVSPYGWTFADCDKFTWDFGDGTTPSTLKSPTKTYSTAGAYTVKVKVEGGLSTANVSTTLNVGTTGGGGNPGNPGGGSCGPMYANTNVYISFMGSQSGCTASSGNCTSTEQINFNASTFGGYTFGCGAHSFQWSFGDGTSSTVQNPIKGYSQGGTYTVTLTITSPTSTATMSQPITIGGAGGGNPNVCATMVPGQNVYVAYVGPTSFCSPSSGECKSGEMVSFQAGSNGYAYSCSTHTFSWDFGDGTTSTQQFPVHAYANSGSFTVTLRIANSAQTVTITQPVKVAGTGPGGGSCPTMVSGQNVYVVYSAPSGCNALVGACTDAEEIDFSVGSYGYNLACSPHTFEWDFGDGTKVSTQTAKHRFVTAGTHKVKLKIINSAQTIELTQDVIVSGTSAGTPTTNRRRSTGRR